MCAKPIVDILISFNIGIRAWGRNGPLVISTLDEMGYRMRYPQNIESHAGHTSSEKIIDWLHSDGVLIKVK